MKEIGQTCGRSARMRPEQATSDRSLVTAAKHVYSNSVWMIPRPLRRSDAMARYIGVDLHRNRFTVCILAENGRQ